MNTANDSTTFADMRRQIRAEMDREWEEEGASPEELETSRQLGDLFACELAAGRTPAEIEAAWVDKSAEEILNEYALPAPAETARA